MMMLCLGHHGNRGIAHDRESEKGNDRRKKTRYTIHAHG
jgi:hypothetical protein